jgi:hypothetical protein
MSKSKHQIPGRVRTAYEFIKENRDRFSIQTMCRVLEVAPSGYYDRLKQTISNRAQEDARLMRLIRASRESWQRRQRLFMRQVKAGDKTRRWRHSLPRYVRGGRARASRTNASTLVTHSSALATATW